MHPLQFHAQPCPSVRNVYILINFGDFILGTTNRAAPFIQLLSTTNNSAQATAEFVAVRGSNPAASSTAPVRPVNTSSVDSTTSADITWFKAHAKILFIIGALVLGAIAMFIIAIFYFYRRRARNRSQDAYSTKITFGPYAPLNAPAPAPATDMHMPYPGQPAWNGDQRYSEPWAPRY
jgi:hypothetical protein